MLMAIILLSLLFIAGFLCTLFRSQTKKLIPWFQSTFFTKTTSKISLTKPRTIIPHNKGKSGISHNKAELKIVFETFDKNKDGFITKKELKDSLKKIGLHMEEGEITEMVQRVDSNEDGLIDIDEFYKVFESVVRREEEEEEGESEERELKEAFDVFDGDRDGFITVEELGLMLNSLGFKEWKSVESVKEMITKVDGDGDGRVSFDEFKNMMKSGERLVAVS